MKNTMNEDAGQARACVKLPVSFGWTREEIKEINPHLSESQIEAIYNAAYELQVGFDLDAEKFVSIETVTFYSKPARSF